MPIDRSLPAGIPSRREAAAGGALVAARARQPSGQNVARFIAREEQLQQARHYVRGNEVTASRTRWEEKQSLCAGNGARTQQRQQLSEELQLVNKELLAVRHDRLKKYYDDCYNEWEEELRARGLAIIRDRD